MWHIDSLDASPHAVACNMHHGHACHIVAAQVCMLSRSFDEQTSHSILACAGAMTEGARSCLWPVKAAGGRSGVRYEGDT